MSEITLHEQWLAEQPEYKIKNTVDCLTATPESWRKIRTGGHPCPQVPSGVKLNLSPKYWIHIELDYDDDATFGDVADQFAERLKPMLEERIPFIRRVYKMRKPSGKPSTTRG